jgi:mitochondrial chaperone BCS1
MVDIKKGSPWESVVLTTLSRDRHVFNELLSEARQLAINLQEGKTVVYTCWGLEWKPFGQPRRKRPLNSVVLDEGVKERIVGDVKDFLSASRYYYDRGSLLLKVRVVCGSDS